MIENDLYFGGSNIISTSNCVNMDHECDSKYQFFMAKMWKKEKPL